MSRTVVVTGSSRGIGLAVAVAFAEAGDTVVATMRDPAIADELLAAADAAGTTVDVVALDVTDDGSVERAFADVRERHGAVDVLVNNAGVTWVGTLEELSIDDIQRSLEVNFLGAMRCTKAVLPGMREAGHGRIIGISSFGGAFGQPFNDAYVAAKCALEGVYESLAPVMRQFGVHVSIVEPGPVDTGIRARSAGVVGDARLPPYQALFDRYLEVTDVGFDKAQKTASAAARILAVADDPEPRLRYQTNSFGERIVGIKLGDLTGERLMDYTTSWITPA